MHPRKVILRSAARLLVAGVSLLAMAPALGQTAAPAPAAPAPADAAAPDDFEAIVVTATAIGQSKFRTSYAITSLDAQDLVRLAPLSTADLLGQVRGVFAEASGGEASNVYRVRGIPNEGSFQAFQEDGLPLYPESAGFFFTGDGIQRIDVMTERYEAVIGGPAPVFATNATAIYNLVTRQGGDTLKGEGRLTLGDTGLYRGEAFVSGPLGPRTYFAVGGFYRYHDGYRKAGYPTDEGGQIRLNLRQEFDTFEVRAHFKYFNDSNIFFLPIPLADPRDPSRSLNEFVDIFTGTLNTPALADGRAVFRYTSAAAAGAVTTENRSLDNRRDTRYLATGLELDFHPSDQLSLVNRLRYTRGDLDFDAIYSSQNPQDAGAFAAARLGAARAAFGPDVARLGYAFAGSRGLTPYDPASESGLVIPVDYRAIQTEFEAIQNDLRTTFKFNLAGRHELTAGINIAIFTSDATWRGQAYLFQLRSQPQPIDLVAYNAGGQPIGFVTDNGVLAYSTTLISGRSQVHQWDLYGADSWALTDRLTLEAGFRHTLYAGNGFFRAPRPFNLGDPTTLADNAAQGFSGVNVPTRIDHEHTAWTAGANWTVTEQLGLYVRASRAYRGPSEFNLIIPIIPVITSAQQYEAGVKLRLPNFSLFATAFYSRFDPFTATLFADNPDGSQGFAAFVGRVTSPGVEAEFSWRPASFFALDGTVTYNTPRLGDFTSASGATVVRADGNLPIRQPEFYGNIRPSVFFDVGSTKLTGFARFNFISRRFVDLENQTEMPGYETLQLGISAVRGRQSLQIVGDNITNARGITEGNPRQDQLAGQGASRVIYGRPIFGRNVRLIASYAF